MENINKALYTLLQRLPDKVKEKRYLSAKEAEWVLGIKSKTLLNRSLLPSKNKRYIPSIQKEGDRRKYFDRTVLETLIIPVPPEDW